MLFVDFVNFFLFLKCRASYKFLAFTIFFIIVFSVFLASFFSGRQPATVALDLGISFVRLLSPLVISILCYEVVGREFDRRYYFSSFSYPLFRVEFFLGRYFSLLFLILVMLAFMALILFLVVYFIGESFSQETPVNLCWNYFVTFMFIAVEMIFLTALATFFSVIASGLGFVLIGTFGFILVARSYADILALLTSNGHLVNNSESYRENLNLLGYLLPDLGALDIRAIALYNDLSLLPADWPWHLARTLIYTLALLALGVWTLQRKRF